MAVAMGDEIDAQDEILESVQGQTGYTEDRIDHATNRANKIIRKY